MPEVEKNTTDSHIVNPEDPTKAMENPDFVKPEPKQAPTSTEKLDLNAAPNAVNVGTTGNPDVDSVGKLLAQKEVANADAIIKEYAETGEVSLANKAVILTALGDTVGELALKQLASVATKANEQNASARAEVLDYANEVFNGKDSAQTWEEIQDYVKTPESGFSPEDRATMTKMLAAGGYQARLVIDNVKAVHDNDSNTTTTADLLSGDTIVQGSFEALTSREYSVLVDEAAKKFGYESTEVQRLQTRRNRSIAKGI